VDDPVLDVCHRRGGDDQDRLQDRIAYVLQQPLAGAENYRDDVKIELVERSGREVLRNRARAARDRDVGLARCRPGLLPSMTPLGGRNHR